MFYKIPFYIDLQKDRPGHLLLTPMGENLEQKLFLAKHFSFDKSLLFRFGYSKKNLRSYFKKYDSGCEYRDDLGYHFLSTLKALEL